MMNPLLKMKIFHWLLLLGFCTWACSPPGPANTPARANVPAADKIRGLSFVAPPKPFDQNPMEDICQTGAKWIAVIPYGFSPPGKPHVHYNPHGWQWWGERPEGIRASIALAHSEGLRVMLKPQVYVPGSWTGKIDFDSDADWSQWESDYEAYLLPMAQLADSLHTELLCIGTEFSISAVKRESWWRNLIRKIRTVYHGKLVYAANWDDYRRVPFWDALDYIGINAYFPLCPDATPNTAALVKSWQPYADEIRAFQLRTGMPVLFTEFGYLSVDGCAYQNWELENRIDQLSVNEIAQANALEALFEVFWKEDYWAGGFLWKWFPNMSGHEGYPDKDYTPQGKKGEKTLREWYSR